MRVGEDTALSEIIKMVSDAAATKAPIAKIADKVSGIFVPVVMIIAAVTEDELLRFAASLVAKSEHPLARAVIAEAEKRHIAAAEVTDFSALPGNGLTAVIGESELSGRNLKFIETKANVPQNIGLLADELSKSGQTPLFFSKDNRLLGVVSVADAVKEDSPQAVCEMRDMGIRVVMLTGDNENTAQAVGAAAGIGEVIAGVLPDGKETVIRNLKTGSKVAWWATVSTLCG